MNLAPHPLRCYKNNSLRGFTLIELSIVLIIVALIAGGILAGRELVAGAKMRKQIAQFTDYQTAVNVFKVNYESFPGDMTKTQAARFFPSIGHAGCSTFRGNGRLDYRTIDINNSCRELRFFFQQLGASGLVGNQFDTSFSRSGVPESAFGENISLVAAGMCCGATQTQLSASQETDYNYAAAFYLTYVNFASGGQGVISGEGMGLTPQFAQSLDQKIDDGVARQGTVKAYNLRNNTAANTCLTGVDGDYNLTVNPRACTMEYIAFR